MDDFNAMREQSEEDEESEDDLGQIGGPMIKSQ